MANRTSQSHYFQIVLLLLGAVLTGLAHERWWAGVSIATLGLAYIMWRRQSPRYAVIATYVLGAGAFSLGTYKEVVEHLRASCEITVTDVDGRPCADVEILAVDLSSPLPIAVSGTTDNSGHVEFADLRRRKYRFYAFKAERDQASTFDFTRVLGDAQNAFPIRGFPNTTGLMAVAGPIYFEIGDSTLDEPAQDAAGTVLLQLPKTGGVMIIEGHTDEKGRDDYNFELGQERAITIWKMISTGRRPKNLIIVSYGKTRQVEIGPFREDRKNRRVIIRIMPGLTHPPNALATTTGISKSGGGELK